MWAAGATTGYFIAKWVTKLTRSATNQNRPALSSNKPMRDVKVTKTSHELLERIIAYVML
jgi:hypothetical protein